MENRSFDHFLGWLPNADGKQAGLTYRDKQGIAHHTYSLSGDYTGCPHPDPDHSYDGGRVQYDGGKMDGFLRSGANDIYSIGYYKQNDIPFYAALARNYTTCDRYFPSILGPTFPNRIFLHAAQTDRLSNTAAPSSLPTIGTSSPPPVSAPTTTIPTFVLGLWGPKYAAFRGPTQIFCSPPLPERCPRFLSSIPSTPFSTTAPATTIIRTPTFAKRSLPVRHIPGRGQWPELAQHGLHRKF